MYTHSFVCIGFWMHLFVARTPAKIDTSRIARNTQLRNQTFFYCIYFTLLPLQIASHPIHISAVMYDAFSAESGYTPNCDAVTWKYSFENVCGYDVDCVAMYADCICDAHNTYDTAYHRKPIQNAMCSILKMDLVVPIGG